MLSWSGNEGGGRLGVLLAGGVGDRQDPKDALGAGSKVWLGEGVTVPDGGVCWCGCC